MAKRILVVDDEQTIARLVQVNLQQAGYEVEVAFDGRDALRMLDSFMPELIILDVAMPYADGYEIMDVLKTSSDTERIPVIMLTAKSDEADVMRGWRSGVDCYLTKPFEIEELLKFVQRILSGEEIPQPPPSREPP